MTRMKESGIDWIGQIPEEWEVTKLKYALLISNGKDYKDIEVEEGGYPVIGSGGVFARARNYMYDGDVVLLGRKGTIDKPLFYSGKFWTVDTMFYSTALNGNNIKFMYYSSLLIPFSYYSTATALPSMTQSDLNNHVLCLPSVSEQQKIADFLDKKTAQLDKVKVLLEEQIQKLKDYRASLIYETVTKGLDKTAPLKDSGIDWIGQVPQGWGVKPLKYLIKFKNGYAFDSKLLTMEQTGVKVIRIGDFKPSGIDFNAALNVFTSFNSKLDFYRIRKSQILIAMSGATVGKISFVNQEPNVYSVINQRVGIIESEINKWIYYCLSTDSFTSYIQLNSNGSAQPNISSSEISDFKVGIPDDVVIQKCVKYLDNQLESINKLIQIKNQQIENINKQRQTLIFDYVTGKRRV